MAFDSTLAQVALLLGRVLFGGVLAFNGLNHFMNRADMTGYAASKGVPAPGLSVLATGAVLLFGGLGIVLGAFPLVAAVALAGFLLVTTPLMHDFWTVSDPQQRQSEMTNFLKNAALLGGALVFLALATKPWSYALGVGL